MAMPLGLVAGDGFKTVLFLGEDMQGFIKKLIPRVIKKKIKETNNFTLFFCLVLHYG